MRHILACPRRPESPSRKWAPYSRCHGSSRGPGTCAIREATAKTRHSSPSHKPAPQVARRPGGLALLAAQISSLRYLAVVDADSRAALRRSRRRRRSRKRSFSRSASSPLSRSTSTGASTVPRAGRDTFWLVWSLQGIRRPSLAVLTHAADPGMPRPLAAFSSSWLLRPRLIHCPRRCPGSERHVKTLAIQWLHVMATAPRPGAHALPESAQHEDDAQESRQDRRALSPR